MKEKIGCPSCSYSGAIHEFSIKGKRDYLNGWLTLDSVRFKCPSCDSSLKLILPKVFWICLIATVVAYLTVVWVYRDIAVLLTVLFFVVLFVIKKFLYRVDFEVEKGE